MRLPRPRIRELRDENEALREALHEVEDIVTAALYRMKGRAAPPYQQQSASTQTDLALSPGDNKPDDVEGTGMDPASRSRGALANLEDRA